MGKFYTYYKNVGSKIYVRGVDSEGMRVKSVVEEYPLDLYHKNPTNHGKSKSIYGEDLYLIPFGDVRSFKEYVYQNKDKKDLYGNFDPSMQYISKEYEGDLTLDIDKVKILCFDIEVRHDAPPSDDEVIEVRRGSREGETKKLTVKEAKELGPTWHVFDPILETYRSIPSSHLFRKGGFPNPDEASDEILSITVKVFGEKKSYGFGLRPYEINGSQKHLKFDDDEGEQPYEEEYFHCENEKDLIKRFIKFWEKIDPDIITGWYIEGFDIPYLINRSRKILGKPFTNKLSPFSTETPEGIKPKTIGTVRKINSFTILGCTIFDYVNIYKNFSLEVLESYKLDFVAQREVGQKKVVFSEFDDNLMKLYQGDFQKFIEYNFIDTFLVEKIDNRKKFIQLALTISLLTKCKPEDALGTVNPWDCHVYDALRVRDIQVPPVDFTNNHIGIMGGFVKSPHIGKQNWIVSFDLTSLYPSIMRMYNMSPETIVENESEDVAQFLDDMLNNPGKVENLLASNRNLNYVTAANGSAYTQNKQGIFPILVSNLFKSRKEKKNKMLALQNQYEKNRGDHKLKNEIDLLDSYQNAFKRLLNSLYGAIANEYFRYFNRNIAQGITATGQLTIKNISNKINVYLNNICKTEDVDYVVASDTDSIYLCLENLVRMLGVKETDYKKKRLQIINLLDKFSQEKIAPFIKKEMEALSNYVGSINNTMNMDREVIADVGIFRGKKNYMLQVWDKEGVRYKEPLIKTQGVETVRSSTPNIVRDELKYMFRVMLNDTNEDLIERVGVFKKRFMSAPLEEIASPRGITDIEKWKDTTNVYKLRTPIHVKGSLFHNKLVKEKNLESEYEYITSGSKIKFIYLKIPNPIQSNVISFIGTLPKEFELDEYIDREMQFVKTFLSPLKSFTNLIGWTTENVNTLSDMWV